jgi:GH24 family phage-related lysozyme (muramidase)
MVMCIATSWLGYALVVLSAAQTAAGADMDREKLRKQIVKHEGSKTKVYLDTEGHPTVGVGFNLDRPGAKAKIEALGLSFAQVKSGKQELTQEQITKLLEDDLDVAIRDAKSLFPNFGDLSDVRQRVLVDMTFNLGKGKLAGFKNMIAAVKAKDFARAADEMKSSKWYKQVGQRGKTLEAMMRTGAD